MKKFILSILLLPLLLAGCIKADIGIELKEDGSGNATAIIGVEKDSPFAEAGTAQFENAVAEMEAEGYTAELVEDDTFLGVKASKPFTNINDVEFFDEMMGESDESLFRITNETGLFTSKMIIEGELSGEEGPEGEETDGLNLEGAEQLGMLMANQFDITFSLTLPGEVSNHNADRVDGNTLVWEMKTDGPTEVYAEILKTNPLSYLILIIPFALLVFGTIYILRI